MVVGGVYLLFDVCLEGGCCCMGCVVCLGVVWFGGILCVGI